MFHVVELLTARSKLAEVLKDVYVEEGNPFNRHAALLSKRLGSHGEDDSVEAVAKLKKASNSARKQYEARVAMLDKIVGFFHEFPTKSKRHDKVSEQLTVELGDFHEQRLDALDSILVQSLETEQKLSAAMRLPEEALPLVAEARNINDARKENFSPKTNTSLKSLLTHPNSIEYLKCFFKKRQMSESLQFWLEVQKFKQLDGELIDTGAQFIYNLYISDNGARAVNLASEDADPIHRAIKAPTRTMFDQAAKSIATLLEDNLGGFHSSRYYKKMVSHCKPMRSFQEFVADIGGPPTGKHLTTHRRGSVASSHPQSFSIESTETRQSETLNLHRTLNLPDVTITCMHPTPVDILCGCLDGSILSLKYDKVSISVAMTIVVPSGYIEGKIVSLSRHSGTELILLTDRGTVQVFDLQKKKITSKLNKNGEPFASGFLRVDANRVLMSFGKTIQDWIWNSKKKKFSPVTTRELGRVISTFTRIDNSVWVGDELGGVTRLHLQTLHPILERIRISSSPVHFIHRSDYQNIQVTDFTSVVSRVWVSCRDHALSVFDTDGVLISKVDIASVHDLCVIGAANFDKHVVLAGEDGVLSLWNPESLLMEERLGAAHKDSISSICCDAAQKLLYSAGLDRLVATWQAKPKATNTTSSSATLVTNSSASNSLNTSGNMPVQTTSGTASPNSEVARSPSQHVEIRSPTPPRMASPTRSRPSPSGRSRKPNLPRAKSLVEHNPLNQALHRNRDENMDPASSHGRSYTMTVDSLLHMTKHPEDSASSLVTQRGGALNSSSAGTDEDEIGTTGSFDLAKFSASDSSMFSSSVEAYSSNRKELHLSARSTNSARSGNSVASSPIDGER